MQKSQITLNKKKLFLSNDRDSFMEKIIKCNDFNSTNVCQPSTPIIPSSSRNILTLDRKGPRSLLASPLPSRMKDGENIFNGSFSSNIPLIKSFKKTKNMDFSIKSMNERDQVNQLHLEKVFGFTIQNNASVALDPTSGIIAFPAGCVVVGYSPKRSKQFFIHNSTKSPITALAFSRDGKLLATGESGKAPKVKIWNVETRTQIAEFNGHNYRVGALTFSPTSRFVVSVGSQEDMTINVWEMSSNLRMASSRVTSKVNAVAFSESGHFFVTVGVRHVRFWYLDNSRSKTKTTMALSGRNAILGEFMNNTFNDVGCCCLNSNSGAGQMTSSTCSSISSCNNQSYTYVISQAGQLMQFTEQRYLDKWVELQTPKASCLTVCESYIMVGCSRGVVLIFDTASLSHLTTLPKPHCLGVDIQTKNFDQGLKNDNMRYPDIIAGKYDHIHSRVTYFYNDHSLYVWDVRDIKCLTKVTSHIFHSGGVWSVESVSLRLREPKSVIDVSSFITCSDDGTVRFWNLPDSTAKLLHSQSEKLPEQWRNDFSKELLKVIYTDPYLKCLTENDRYLVKSNHQNNDSNSILKHGIRSIKISPDREHLATADREGNLRFYSLNDCKELHSIIAHNGEILSIDYFQSPSAPDLILFCSASRDRIIHIMDPSQQYRCIQTIDDHSGAIFSVKLVETPSDQEIRLISCGMDKSLLFRILQPDESGQTAQFFLNQHLVGKQSQYDMVIAPNNRYAAVACQDRQVRIYNLVTGKQRKSYRGSIGDDGNLLRCAIDPSGTYLATSASDKCLHILNFTTGEILHSATGHSEMALGICFLHDLKHLISVSSDNCIFVWRLPVEMTLTMHMKMQQLGSPINEHFPDYDVKKGTAPSSTCGTVTPPRMSDETTMGSSIISSCTNGSGDNIDIGSPSTFRFSVSALPSWAQKKFSRRDSITFVQVNMLNEFCTGMSTVIERKEENLFFSDDLEKENCHSRRMSFIATEKVVRDDDSDNVEEDDSEWFSVEKNDFEQSVDLEFLLPRLSTADENDDEDEEEEDSLMSPKPPIRSVSLQSEEKDKNYECVIQSNEDSKIDGTPLSTSAPSDMTVWIDDKSIHSSSEESQFNQSNDNPLDNDCHNSYDESLTPDYGTLTSSRLERSLTTRYLSKSLAGSNNVNFKFKTDQGISDKSVEKVPETNSRKIDTITNTSTPKKTLSEKCKSEVNVSQICNIQKKSDSYLGHIHNNNRTTKSIVSCGQYSQDSKEIKINDKNSKIDKFKGKAGLSKSHSIASVSLFEPYTEVRPKSGPLGRKSYETKSVTNKPSIDVNIKSPRPKWGDSKSTRVLRRTCPVDIKDIKDAHSRHSTVSVNQSLSNNPPKIPPNVNHNKIELEIQSCKSRDESKIIKHNLSKGSSFDLISSQGKEHVIDEIEEIPSTSSLENSNTNYLPSVFEEMMKSLATQNQTGSNVSFPDPSVNVRLNSSGGECEMVKSIDLGSIEICTDEWITDLCEGHSLDFLTTMASKILHRLIDNPELNSESQKLVATRLFTEIDRIYHQLQSTLDLVPRTLDSDTTASLIRDIGERIVDEVKRRFSESL